MDLSIKLRAKADQRCGNLQALGLHIRVRQFMIHPPLSRDDCYQICLWVRGVMCKFDQPSAYF